ncbi:hypothetical protein EGI32_08525 [Ferruginibacter sp. HRS2-29]|nr:hypothetical protein [Ferruginibacter sp. HRS2-29]
MQTNTKGSVAKRIYYVRDASVQGKGHIIVQTEKVGVEGHKKSAILKALFIIQEQYISNMKSIKVKAKEIQFLKNTCEIDILNMFKSNFLFEEISQNCIFLSDNNSN